MESLTNLFALPSPLDDKEHFDVLAQGKGVKIERIVSTGQTTPDGEWYDQESDEWVALLQGEAELRYEDGQVTPLVAGDYVYIPAHRKHRVERTSASPPCVWLALHVDEGALSPTNG